MKRYIVVLMLVVPLVGCGGSISSAGVEKAQELCDPNGGLSGLSVSTLHRAYCKNGARFTLGKK